MSLPKISYPTSIFKIPSTGQEVTVRPYLAKEEKILLMAKETENLLEIVNAIKQVINNCIITPNINVNKLATFDIEYLFLKLRAISVSNIMHLEFTDNEEPPNDKGIKKIYKFDVDLLKVEVNFPENVSNKIKISENMGLIMKYLTLDIPVSIQEKKTEVEILFDLINICIDKVWKGSELYNFKEQPEKERMEFINSLPDHTLEDLSKFLKTMPKLIYTIEYENTLGHKRKIKMEKLDDFFSLR